MESATEGAGGGSPEGDSFVELLLQEVKNNDLSCPSVQMLVEMAKSGDNDTVADALSYLVEAGVPDKAAACLRQIMVQARKAPKPGADAQTGEGTSSGPVAPPNGPAQTELLDYALAGRILNRRVHDGARIQLRPP